MRRFALVLMIPIVLLLAIPALAQAADRPGSAATGSSLEAEVAELKRLVAEHERRIAALEAALAKVVPAAVATEPVEDSAEQAHEPVSASATRTEFGRVGPNRRPDCGSDPARGRASVVGAGGELAARSGSA